MLTRMKLSAHVKSVCVCAKYETECTLKGCVFTCMHTVSVRVKTEV